MKKLWMVLVLLWPVGAAAEFVTFGELNGRCADTKSGEPKADMAKYNTCGAYLSGLIDSTAAQQRHIKAKLKEVALPGSCFPADVSIEQLRQVWLDATKSLPKNLRTNAAGLALAAFEKAWPC